jgi:virginiamycin B lyase
MVGRRTLPRPNVRARVLAASLAVIVAAAAGPPASAAPVPEYSGYALPVDGSIPFAITTGPDGGLWFTERGTDSIRRSSADGVFSAPVSLAVAADPTAIATGPDGALWFTQFGAGSIGRLTTDGALTEFAVNSTNAGPMGIVPGPDGALWFTERSAHRIGRIALDGTVTEFEVPTRLAGPMAIAAGPDGALWFTEQRAGQIGRITTDGVVTEYALPVATSLPGGIATGPDGALWFTMRAANRIGRIDTAGSVSSFLVPTDLADPTSIAVGWDGALWFTEPDVDKIGRITTSGTITEFALPNVGASPFGIAAGPDDAVWFTEGNGNRIGRLGLPVAPPDTTAPSISIASPRDGTVVVAGQRLVAGYTCADEPGGSGLASCLGPVGSGEAVDTSAGAHRFSVTASDRDGNAAGASTGYVSFLSVSGSLGGTATQRAGLWSTLELGLAGIRLPRDPAALVAAGFPVTRPVSCADPSISLGPASAADARLQVKQGGLSIRWRTDRAWTGTCRTLELRFVAAGWTGVDAVFQARFG